MKYQIEINGLKTELERVGENFSINDSPIAYEIHSSSSHEVVLRIGHEMFTVQLQSDSEDGSKFSARVNGKKVDLTLKTETDLLLEKLGVGTGSSVSGKKIKAPMPGLITKILVSVGDQIEKGTVLLNFEAMKMENQLKAPGNGVVKTIHVDLGAKVEKGQLLVEIE